MTATETTETVSTPSFELVSPEEATARIKELNEPLIKSSKSAGLAALDAFEKAVESLVAFEEKVSAASQLDWVSSFTGTHITFIQEVSASYTKAARELLK